MSKQTVIEKLKKVIEVLESGHLREVEVSYRGSFDLIRYYDVKTCNGQHKYTVRVQDWFNEETNTSERWAKCSCKAGASEIVCRHVLKVSQIDAEKFGKEVFVETFQNYKAHQVSRQEKENQVRMAA